ncbi:MAG: hypothetical protein NTW19_03360 [Planctomycetota bacterium]|nr:hypothetical protein [Planctomycetota bacterium]
MPHVVNGIGTWYHGKKNVVTYDGVCGSCKGHVTLTSYDTRLFFVVIFIPIIPLARKRIIEQCPACQRHRALPLAEWEKIRQRVREAIEAYRKAPSNKQLAKDALGACLSCRDQPEFLALAPEVEKFLPREPETMKFLAGSHEVFGRTADAARVLRLVVAAEDSDEHREMLADCLLKLGLPDEAEPLTEHIFEKGIPDRVGLLYSLAQGHQIKGDHDKAMTAFDKCEVVNPAILKDETFVRLREASAKSLGTRTAIRPNEVVRQMKTAVARKRFLKVAGVCAAVALVAYLILALAQGMRRTIYFANGLAKPYTVKINGTPHTLPPLSATPIAVAEGDLKIETPGLGNATGVTVVPIRTSLLTRPFNNRVFVVNPDQVAIIDRVRVYYAAKSPSPPGFTFLPAQLLHEIDGIDHPFVEPPDSITTDSHGELHRDVLRVVSGGPGASPILLLLNLEPKIGKEAVARIARRHLVVEPDDTAYLQILQSRVTPDEFAAAARPHLDARPVNVEWHRAYQHAMEQANRADQIEKEYAELLAKEPTDNELMYVAGRASADPDLYESLAQAAASGDHPSVYALTSLAAHWLVCGRFDESAKMSKAALALKADFPGAQSTLNEAMMATGNYDVLLDGYRKMESEPSPANIFALGSEVICFASKGDMAKARDAAKRMRAIKIPLPPDKLEQFHQNTEATLAYIGGDRALFVSILGKLPSHSGKFAAALTEGQFDAAEKELPGASDAGDDDKAGTDFRNHLLLYILAMRQSRTDKAAAHLTAATAALSEGRRENRAMAAALSGKPAMPFGKLVRLYDSPQQRAVCLVALGLADPSTREEGFALARKLNYNREFPHLFLRDAMDAPPATKP